MNHILCRDIICSIPKDLKISSSQNYLYVTSWRSYGEEYKF